MKSKSQRSRLSTGFQIAGTLALLTGIASCQSIHIKDKAVHAATVHKAAIENKQTAPVASLAVSTASDWQNQPVTLPIQAKEIGISKAGSRVIVLVTNAAGDCIEVWNPQTQERVIGLPVEPDAQFEAIAISDDGSKVAAIAQTQDHNLSLLIWDIDSNQPPVREPLNSSQPASTAHLEEFPQSFARISSAVTFSPDGTQVVTSVRRLNDQDTNNEAQALQLHNATTGVALHTLTTAENTQVEQLAFSPDGKQLVGTGRTHSSSATERAMPDPVIHLWQTENGQLISSFSSSSVTTNDGVSSALGYIAAVTFTPTNQLKTLSNPSLTSDQLVTWELSTPILAAQVQTLPEVDRQDFIHVLSPDGIYHFMRGDVSGTRLLNTNTLEVTRLDERVSKAVFSADGDYLAIATPETVQILSKGDH